MMGCREAIWAGDILGIVEDMAAIAGESPYLADWHTLNAQAPRQCPRCGTIYGVSIADVVLGGNRCPWCGSAGGWIVGSGDQ